jgi:hypothetical protein
LEQLLFFSESGNGAFAFKNINPNSNFFRIDRNYIVGGVGMISFLTLIIGAVLTNLFETTDVFGLLWDLIAGLF